MDLVLDTHLPGQHNQADHGRRKTGITAISAALQRRIKKITGRNVPVDLSGVDPDIAREFAAGIVEGLNRFPKTKLRSVNTYGPNSSDPEMSPDRLYAATLFGFDGSDIYLNTAFTGNAQVFRSEMARAARGRALSAPSARGIALHELGHVLSNSAPAHVMDRAVDTLIDEGAEREGISPSQFIDRHVSQRANQTEVAGGELLPELFADAMANGDNASPISKAALSIIERIYGETVEVDTQRRPIVAAAAPGDPQVQGSTPEELEQQATLIEEAVAAALALVAAQAAASVLGAVPGFVGTAVVAAPWVSLDDVATVPTMWLTQVDDTVVPLLRGILDEQAADVREQIQAVVDAQPGIYGVPSLIDGEPPVVPTVSDIPNVTSDQLMAQARNRLVGIGDLLWVDIRAQLTEGITAGETVEQLAKRVEATAGVAEPRARTIARTETISVSNWSSIAQARSAGFPMRKTWLATDDERTRLWHVEADNQTVGLDDLFEVGPDFLDYPGDPTGSPGNVINCRCGIGFTLLGLPAPTTASIGDAHLPGKHDQSSHGHKGIRKPDTQVSERTRARRSQADRERRDIEAQARREAQEAVDMHAARAMAELAIDFEEMIAKGATRRAMTHRVRSAMRRLKLEPSQERAGDVVPFDRGRYQPIGGGTIADGAAVQVVRPGYVWGRPGGDVLIERPVVQAVGDEPTTAAVDLDAHLPGLHDQKDHGRRYATPKRPKVARKPEAASERVSHLSRAQQVERARKHLDSIVKAWPTMMGEGEQQRAEDEIREALAFQAVLTPRTAMTLTSVGKQEWWNWELAIGANAAYAPSERSIGVSSRWTNDNDQISRETVRNVREGFNTPHGTSSQLGSTVAHEFGHHVMRQIYNWDLVDPGDPDRGSAGMPMDVARRFMGSVSRALKVPEPDYDAEPDQAVVSDNGLNAWYEKAKRQADEIGLSNVYRISGYAAQGGFQELFAEVWREYSTRGRKARTMVKQIGAAMAREAERNAP